MPNPRLQDLCYNDIEGNVPPDELRLIQNDSIYFVRDRAGILILDPERTSYWLLTGLEADIWDWIVLNQPFEEICHMAALCLEIPERTAKERVFDTLRKWVSAGFLRAEEA
jgi:hypothetical protein